jgi:hypothetical protein
MVIERAWKSLLPKMAKCSDMWNIVLCLGLWFAIRKHLGITWKQHLFVCCLCWFLYNMEIQPTGHEIMWWFCLHISGWLWCKNTWIVNDLWHGKMTKCDKCREMFHPKLCERLLVWFISSMRLKKIYLNSIALPSLFAHGLIEFFERPGSVFPVA